MISIKQQIHSVTCKASDTTYTHNKLSLAMLLDVIELRVLNVLYCMRLYYYFNVSKLRNVTLKIDNIGL